MVFAQPAGWGHERERYISCRIVRGKKYQAAQKYHAAVHDVCALWTCSGEALVSTSLHCAWTGDGLKDSR